MLLHIEYSMHQINLIAHAASYAGYEFALSRGMESARASTEMKRRVNIDKEEICAYGRVRYLLENRNDNDIAFKVTTSFYNAIKRITAQEWDPSSYFPFLDEWGTVRYNTVCNCSSCIESNLCFVLFQHIIVEADVGTRNICRSYLSYFETYKYLLNKVSSLLIYVPTDTVTGIIIYYSGEFKLQYEKPLERNKLI